MIGEALAFAATALFASGMHRHARAIAGRSLTGAEQHRLLLAGWLALAMGTGIALAGGGAGIAIVRLIGWLAAAALVTTLIVRSAPRLLLPVAGASVVAGLVAVLV